MRSLLDVYGYVVVDNVNDEVMTNYGMIAITPREAMVIDTEADAQRIAKQMDKDSEFGVKHEVKPCILKLEIL